MGKIELAADQALSPAFSPDLLCIDERGLYCAKGDFGLTRGDQCRARS